MLAPQDAKMYWLAQRLRNDQFLLFCFDGATESVAALRAFVARRVALIPDLGVRVHEVPATLDYPHWAPRDFGDDQFVVHDGGSWEAVTDALGELVATGVDARVSPWRLHVFGGVIGAPRCSSNALVAVLQVSHALADGRKASELARALFGASDPVAAQSFPALAPDLLLAASGLARVPGQMVRTLYRGYRAYRAYQELTELDAAGELPPRNPGQRLSAVNRAPAGRHQVRMLVCDNAALRRDGTTVTVAATTAVSVALAEYLGDDRIGAELTVATPRTGRAGNSFRNVGVDLFASEPDLHRRARLIADLLEQRRARATHPLLRVADRVGDVVPAFLLRREVAGYPIDVVPATVSGNTVVSSVFRGSADLGFGGGQVRFTAGFPALSPVMALTHGVHGIGDTVTVSVHADSVVVPDIDRYTGLLAAALKR